MFETIPKAIGQLTSDTITGNDEYPLYRRRSSETLDVVKSVPDFEGKHEMYVSLRKVAHTVYKV